MLLPVAVHAGVAYDIAVRPVDDSNLSSLAAGVAPAVVTRYFVENGQVRAAGAAAKQVYLFKDRTMYVIDTAGRTVHVLKHATLTDVLSHYADAVKQLQDAAAAASPDERAAAEQKAADMRAVADRLRQPVAREYRLTVRFESVDGRACRIWEEREEGAKRLELCVAPVASVPGGPDILRGMKTLSQFRQGSDLAFGVDFGLSDWWSDIETLNGVPLLIRQYKFDSEVSETMLSSPHTGVARGTQLDLPEDYRLQDGPDYAQWYLR